MDGKPASGQRFFDKMPAIKLACSLTLVPDLKVTARKDFLFESNPLNGLLSSFPFSLDWLPAFELASIRMQSFLACSLTGTNIPYESE